MSLSCVAGFFFSSKHSLLEEKVQEAAGSHKIHTAPPEVMKGENNFCE